MHEQRNLRHAVALTKAHHVLFNGSLNVGQIDDASSSGKYRVGSGDNA